MKEQTETPLTERRVVRRGLMAGLATFAAAAAVRVTGAGRATAANGDPLRVGEVNTGTLGTMLQSTGAFPSIDIVNGVQLSIASPTGLSAASVSGVTGSIANSFGVVGFSDNSGAEAVGVFGLTNAGIGVRGRTITLMGVDGLALGSGGVGVRGANTDNGTGVKGVSNAPGLGSEVADGTGSGIGVQGKSTGGPGVEGISVGSLGVRGVSTSSVGVVGISTGNHGLYGSTSSAGSAGFVGENLAGGLAGYFAGNVMVTGSFQVVGAKNALIKMQDGTLGSVYCQESPEPYFEDFGRAQLVGGVASVSLEREFASLVAGGDYMVFTHPEGDTRGLFISRRSANGFEVREVQGGTGNVPFTYRIVTKRKDIEGKRFARVVDNVGPALAASRAAMGIMGAPPSPPPPIAPVPNATQPSPTAPTNPTTPGQTRPIQSPGPIAQTP